MPGGGGRSTGGGIRSLGLAVFAPSFLFALGQGAVIPIVALAAVDRGASLATAGLIVSLRGIGTLVFDLPAGALVSRLGEHRGLVLGTAMLAVALVGAVLSSSATLLAGASVLMGCGWAVWQVGRLAYVSAVTPVHLRGRTLSSLAIVDGSGKLVGPFLGAFVVSLSDLNGVFYLHLVASVLGLCVLFAVPGAALPSALDVGHVPFARVLRDNARVFATVGLGVTTLMILRTSREVLVPLWAVHIGLNASQVSVVFGVSSALGLSLFYLAGLIMDRMGRKWAAIPSLALMSIGYLVLPFTSDFRSFLLLGVILGLGEGIGGGINMTLGVDHAPEAGRAGFLGVWRFVGDLGTAGGPLLVSSAVAAASLSSAAGSLALIGLGGSVLLGTQMSDPGHVVRARASRRNSGSLDDTRGIPP